jgi:hypothetical protein
MASVPLLCFRWLGRPLMCEIWAVDKWWRIVPGILSYDVTLVDKLGHIVWPIVSHSVSNCVTKRDQLCHNVWLIVTQCDRLCHTVWPIVSHYVTNCVTLIDQLWYTVLPIVSHSVTNCVTLFKRRKPKKIVSQMCGLCTLCTEHGFY